MTLPKHAKSMQFTFDNKIIETTCLRVTIPHTMKNKGSYMKIYRSLKEAVSKSEGIPISSIRGKSELVTAPIQENILYEWAGGISLYVPDDATSYDYEIILKQLEVLQMSTTPNPNR